VSSPESSNVLRVLIVDDHRTFAELLAMGLDSQPDIRCVGHVQQAAGAADAVAALQPDVALVDVHLGQDDGLVLAAELHARYPQLRIIALTASLDPVNIARAAKAGVCAYLPKAGALEEVLNAVRTARVGHLVLQPHMVLDLIALDHSAAAGARPGRPAVLTAREQQVLEGLSEGMDVTSIAKRLGIRTSTCRGYVQNVLTKLGAHTQLEAVAQARSRGMLGLEDSRTREP
jgi:DNA-binding NarL/FixJ family response regulator